MGSRNGRLVRLTVLALTLAVTVACGQAPSPAVAPQPDPSATERAQQAAREAAVTQIVASGSLTALMSEPAVEVKAALPAIDVPAMRHVWQSLNNCGPAAVVMALSTFGIDASQEVARLALRGPDWNRGMGPTPVDPWVREQYGLRSMYRTNGTNALMKKLVTNGFAPMVTQWLEDPWKSRISHWRTVRGYDDARGVFYVNDSMLGRGVPLTYDWFAANWQPFSYRYMVVYRPEDEPRLRAIIGDDWNDVRNRRNFYERSRAEAQAQSTSAAWLAFGEAAYQYGQFAEAVAAFEKGIAIGSPTGVFTLRSSYPNALRALGRHAEANVAAGRLSGITPGIATVAGAATDERILAFAEQREREAWLASLPEERLPVR